MSYQWSFLLDSLPTLQILIYTKSGRVHFLLRYFSLLRSISDFKAEKPSQLLLKCEKEYILKSSLSDNLLKTFLTHSRWTFSIRIPSQLLLKWSICSTSEETFSDSSQWKYLLSSFSNEVHVLHQFLWSLMKLENH